MAFPLAKNAFKGKFGRLHIRKAQNQFFVYYLVHRA